MEHIVITCIIFFIAYSLVVTEAIPRSIAMVLGAVLLISFDVVSQETALHYIDFNTIGLLAGMMLMVAITKRTGLFEFLSVKAIKLSKGYSWRLLLLFAVITAILSAFLDNVTTVIVIAPITIALADAIGINPVPYLITEIFASNIGGTATLIGDPPNIIIGSALNISFLEFITNNTPVVIVIMIYYLLIIKLIYKKEFASTKRYPGVDEMFDERKTLQGNKHIKKSLAVFTLTIIMFLTHSIHGLEAATIALGGGFTLLMLSKLDPEEILSELEYPTLFFLIGIFVIVGAMEEVHIVDAISKILTKYTAGSENLTTISILWISGISTAFVNNIPFTTVMIPIIKDVIHDTQSSSDAYWWALSLGACLGGNGSLAGSAANIVVIALARKNKIKITFKDFFKIAFPLMIGSLIISTVYLYLRYLM